MLLHCFGGCSVRAVLDAIGLDMEALFPPRGDPGYGTPPMRRRGLLSPWQAVELIDDAANVVFCAARTAGSGVPLTDADRRALVAAAAKISEIRRQLRA